MKKQSPKKTMLLMSLICLTSLTALADGPRSSRNRDRSGELDERHSRRDRSDRGQVFRDQHKQMDICTEIREDLIVADEKYSEFENRLATVNRNIEAKTREVRTRKTALSQKQSSFNSANSNLTSLKKRKQQKPQLIQAAKKAISEANAALPAAEQRYNDAKRREDKKCDWRGELRGSCRDAKKEKKKAEKARNELVNKRDQANESIKELNQIDLRIQRAEKVLQTARTALNKENQISPTISQLEVQLQKMVSGRDNSNQGYAQAEGRYFRVLNRLNKCMDMQYESRRAQTFRDSLIAFAANNTEGCDTGMARLAQTRGKAQKDGVQDAYNLICETDTIVRVEEVVREVEVEVPGQPIPAPPVECNDSDRGTPSTGPQVEVISTNVIFREAGSDTYPSLQRETVGVPTELAVLGDRGVSQIRLKIDKVDMEAGYDYLQILDDQGKVVYDATGKAIQGGKKDGWITNPSNGVPAGSIDTGWVQSSSLRIMVYSDNRVERTGFEINSYEVIYE